MITPSFLVTTLLCMVLQVLNLTRWSIGTNAYHMQLDVAFWYHKQNLGRVRQEPLS